jgi:hypothetical protein
MRVTPSATFATTNLFKVNAGSGVNETATGIALAGAGVSTGQINFYINYAAAGAAGRGAIAQANNSTSAKISISAEL